MHKVFFISIFLFIAACSEPRPTENLCPKDQKVEMTGTQYCVLSEGIKTGVEFPLPMPLSTVHKHILISKEVGRDFAAAEAIKEHVKQSEVNCIGAQKCPMFFWSDVEAHRTHSRLPQTGYLLSRDDFPSLTREAFNNLDQADRRALLLASKYYFGELKRQSDGSFFRGIDYYYHYAYSLGLTDEKPFHLFSPWELRAPEPPSKQVITLVSSGQTKKLGRLDDMDAFKLSHSVDDKKVLTFDTIYGNHMYLKLKEEDEFLIAGSTGDVWQREAGKEFVRIYPTQEAISRIYKVVSPHKQTPIELLDGVSFIEETACGPYRCNHYIWKRADQSDHFYFDTESRVLRKRNSVSEDGHRSETTWEYLADNIPHDSFQSKILLNQVRSAERQS